MRPFGPYERWTSENTVLLPPTLGGAEITKGGQRFADPSRHLRVKYVRGGFPGFHPLTLRPLSEATGHAPHGRVTQLSFPDANPPPIRHGRPGG